MILFLASDVLHAPPSHSWAAAGVATPPPPDARIPHPLTNLLTGCPELPPVIHRLTWRDSSDVSDSPEDSVSNGLQITSTVAFFQTSLRPCFGVKHFEKILIFSLGLELYLNRVLRFLIDI